VIIPERLSLVLPILIVASTIAVSLLGTPPVLYS